MINHWIIRIAGVVIAILIYFGCTEREFSETKGIPKCQNFPQECVTVVKNCSEPEYASDLNCEDGVYDYFDYTIAIPREKVDVLFVVDNSGSMSYEQQEIANRFSGFLSIIAQLDYRVGIITTDVSVSPNNEPRDINQFGALQDGKLVEFLDNSKNKTGMKFLTPKNTNRVEYFINTIQRSETLNCEAWLRNTTEQALKYKDRATYNAHSKQNCPSPDERGIYALNMFLDSSADSFLREGAHLAVIIVADEDERSFGGRDGGTTYAPEAWDEPATFVNRFNERYQNSKTLAVHSIVVKDENCRNQQSNQGGLGVQGQIGYYYMALSNLDDSKGIIGDICANNYTTQFEKIGLDILEEVPSQNIACANPLDFFIEMFPESSQTTYSLDGRRIHFYGGFQAGTMIHYNYGCVRH